MKGIIALDLDGTVILDGMAPPQEVSSFLLESQNEGWEIIFITGRSLQWVKRALKDIPFSYTLAVQNGALIIEMPSEKVIKKFYINDEKIPFANIIVEEEGLPYALYSGDGEDHVYWESENFTNEGRDYLEARTKKYHEKWTATPYKPPIFASLKWFAKSDKAERIGARVREELGLYCAVIKDPFDNSISIAQATHPQATKGEALKFLKQGKKGVVIAAGDDHNDEPLLAAADIKIAMENAPAILKEMADIVATEGLIKGIQDARRLKLKSR